MYSLETERRTHYLTNRPPNWQSRNINSIGPHDCLSTDACCSVYERPLCSSTRTETTGCCYAFINVPDIASQIESSYALLAADGQLVAAVVALDARLHLTGF